MSAASEALPSNFALSVVAAPAKAAAASAVRPPVGRLQRLGCAAALWGAAIGAALSGAASLPALARETLQSGIDLRGIDRSVRPQDNLFEFANGEWLKHTPIPSHKATYGAFEILDDEADVRIREIIADAVAAQAAPGTDEQRIGDFFTSYMDEATIERLGLAPLAELLSRAEGLSNVAELPTTLGWLQTVGVDGPIGLYVSIDDKNATQYLTTLYQSGLTLPDRDYYLKDDDKYHSAREALQTYVRRLYEFAGWDDGDQAATEVLALETRLARIQWERTRLRDADQRYNKFALAEWSTEAPGFDWSAYLQAAELPGVGEINVSAPSYFVELQAVIAETPAETWRRYLKFRVVDAYATALPAACFDAQFALYGRELAGLDEPQPRWKRAVAAIAGDRGFGALGDAVGKLYVARHYPAEAAARMEELVGNLLRAFELSIDELAWMTPATKQRAQEKLRKITTKIGHTRAWRDYSALEVKPDELVGNMIRSAQIEHRRMIAKLGQPVDRDEWHMTPHTINAYYNPTMNEIVFPAAILQPPFFDVAADDAANYGSIGGVIGHEISHAFDDQGSKYDGDGNLNNWWSAEDRAAFQQLGQRLVAQFGAYSPLEGRRVNGELTLGENIADLSGIAVAYKAYLLSLEGSEPPVLDGWTGPQRFFLGWSQSWRRKYRDGEMLSRLLTDPHSPAAFRSDGPLVNFDPFYEAFDIQPSDKLFKPPAERIRIW